MIDAMIERPSLEVMAKMWSEGGDAKQPYNISFFTHGLKKFGLNVNQDGEQMLIVGSRNVARHLWENTEGQLIAVAPGILVCNVLPSGAGPYCTGVLRPSGPTRYYVEVFARHNGERIYGNASISVGPGPVDHREAAAVFNWGFGPDQGSSVGITPARWAEMQPWIDRWLNVGK
jgi:hypothetical protein